MKSSANPSVVNDEIFCSKQRSLDPKTKGLR